MVQPGTAVVSQAAKTTLIQRGVGLGLTRAAAATQCEDMLAVGSRIEAGRKARTLNLAGVDPHRAPTALVFTQERN
jgi:hypothetical protein